MDNSETINGCYKQMTKKEVREVVQQELAKIQQDDTLSAIWRILGRFLRRKLGL